MKRLDLLNKDFYCHLSISTTPLPDKQFVVLTLQMDAMKLLQKKRVQRKNNFKRAHQSKSKSTSWKLWMKYGTSICVMYSFEERCSPFIAPHRSDVLSAKIFCLFSGSFSYCHYRVHVHVQMDTPMLPLQGKRLSF